MLLRPKSPKVQRRYQRRWEICTWNIVYTINQQFSTGCKVLLNEPKGIPKACGKIDPQWTAKVPWQRTAPSASVLPWNAFKKGAFLAASAGNGNHFRSCNPVTNGVSRLGQVGSFFLVAIVVFMWHVNSWGETGKHNRIWYVLCMSGLSLGICWL